MVYSTDQVIWLKENKDSRKKKKYVEAFCRNIFLRYLDNAMSPKNAVEILQQNYSHCIIKTYKLNIQHNSINMSKIRSLSQLVSVKKLQKSKTRFSWSDRYFAYKIINHWYHRNSSPIWFTWNPKIREISARVSEEKFQQNSKGKTFTKTAKRYHRHTIIYEIKRLKKHRST